MQALCIRDALSLYKILEPHLPVAFDRNEVAVSYIKEIVDSMVENDPEAYLKAVMLMSGNSREEMEKKYPDGDRVLKLFIEGMIINQVIVLDDFCKQVGL